MRMGEEHGDAVRAWPLLYEVVVGPRGGCGPVVAWVCLPGERAGRAGLQGVAVVRLIHKGEVHAAFLYAWDFARMGSDSGCVV